jgi:serine/threonine protein kinase
MAIQRRCLDEARAMMELQSSHVVRALDVGSLPSGQLYIVMEYLDGEDLNALLVREGPLPWPRVGDMAVQICSGLATAHRRGIIHRDIKPQNCFRVTIDDNPEHIKLIDFGVARDLKGEAGPTQDGFLIGTPEYTAPELVKGHAKANARTDIYALGVTLYKLLTGVVPFQGATPLATLRKHVEAPLVLPSRAAPHLEIPQAADDIIGRALERDPERRFASVDELSRALKSALGLQRSGIMAPPQAPDALPPLAARQDARTAWVQPPLRPPASASSVPPKQPSEPAAHKIADQPPTQSAGAPPGPSTSNGDPAPSHSRSVDRKTLGLRLISLMSLSLLFVVGTKLVSPVMPAQGRPSEQIHRRLAPMMLLELQRLQRRQAQRRASSDAKRLPRTLLQLRFGPKALRNPGSHRRSLNRQRPSPNSRQTPWTTAPPKCPPR